MPNYRDQNQRGGGGRGGGGGGGRSFGPQYPKPYEFVPIPKDKPQLEKPRGHHRYAKQTYTGTLTAEIVAKSPVHVSSGLLKEQNDRQYPLVKAHFRTGDDLAIPGSSLKGCIRSIVEAISGSTVQVTKAIGLLRPPEFQPSRNLDKLDIAQRIFGAMGYQGTVRFSDAIAQEETKTIVLSPQLFRPRQDSTNTYFDGLRIRGRKFYMHGELAGGNLPLEACAIGTIFPFRLDFANLSAGELGLLLIAIGLSEQSFCPKLGGAKPACLGTVKFTKPKLEAVDTTKAYTSFDVPESDVEIEPLMDIAMTEKLALQEQLERLSVTLRFPRDDGRECPKGNY